MRVQSTIVTFSLEGSEIQIEESEEKEKRRKVQEESGRTITIFSCTSDEDANLKMRLCYTSGRDFTLDKSSKKMP